MQIDSDNAVLMQRPVDARPCSGGVDKMHRGGVFVQCGSSFFQHRGSVHAVRDINVSNHLIIHNHSGTDVISHIIRNRAHVFRVYRRQDFIEQRLRGGPISGT